MPGSLLLAALPAAAKIALGAYQLTQHVDRQDTITDAEREQLGLARQGAAASIPGLAAYQGRLAQAQAAATQQAQLGSASGSDYLATVGAADRVRANGEAQLFGQQSAYRDQATRQLSAQLGAYARHQQADTDRALQANAALKSAALQNLSGGLTEGASVAAYGASQPNNAPDSTSSYGTPATSPVGDFPASPYSYPRRNYPNPYRYTG